MNGRSIRSTRLAALLLFLGLAVRLIQIGAPPIGMHSWRQTDTAAMARNFHEGGYRFGSPQVDWGGATPGYVESEFPIYPYTAALGYGLVGGVHEGLGRLLAALAFLIGAWGLFALVRETVDPATALWSLALFLFLPLNLFYSRAFMPEAWMITASILGVLFFHRWTRDRRIVNLFVSGSFVALAALIKLPALYLGLPLLYLAWRRDGRKLFVRPVLWAYAAGVILPVAAWYAHAHGIVERGGLTFRIWEYGSDKWGNWDLVSSLGFWNGIMFRSLAERWFTWPGFALLVVGLCLPRRSAGERLFDWWLLAVLVYFVIVAKGNFVHEYYQFPFMPAGVVFVAKAFARGMPSGRNPILRAGLVAALAGIAVLSAARYADYIRREDPRRSTEAIVGAAARANTEPAALVITPTSGNPTLLYLSHRKGWTVAEAGLTPVFLEQTRREGARYVVGTGPLPKALESSATESTGFRYRTERGYVMELGGDRE